VAIDSHDVARAILYALAQPHGVSVKELVIRPAAAAS